jgi:hypothetical protein
MKISVKLENGKEEPIDGKLPTLILLTAMFFTHSLLLFVSVNYILPVIKKFLLNEDPEVKFQSVQALRMVVDCNPPPVQTIIDENLVPSLAKLLNHNEL